MKEIFPEAEYQLRLLPPQHPAWHAEEPVDPELVRRLEGIDVGCRTSVIFCPQDLSCYWELARPGRARKLSKDVQAQVDAARSVGINVLAYATNRELKYKFELFAKNRPAAAPDDFDRGKLYVARLQHPGGCNAAPGALVNLMQVAGDKLKIRVSTDAREIGISDPQLFHYHLVFMQGRHNFRLTPPERKQLKAYLERGGMLFADSICSSKDFSEAFRREMKTLLPEQPLERIAVNHPLFGTEFGGADLSKVSRRQLQASGAKGPVTTQVRQGEPYLEGIKSGDRYAVIFSPYDVSCALENHESLECEGYIRADAAKIGLNVLVYSLHQ